MASTPAWAVVSSTTAVTNRVPCTKKVDRLRFSAYVGESTMTQRDKLQYLQNDTKRFAPGISDDRSFPIPMTPMVIAISNIRGRVRHESH